jgi:RNA polymerase sigma factor for flagellar operon FliA
MTTTLNAVATNLQTVCDPSEWIGSTINDDGIARRQPLTQEVIESLWPLVGRVVNHLATFLPTYISRGDLMGAGSVGLMDAVSRYDERKGASMNTYCSLRIRGAVLDELRRLDWVPRSVHEDSRKHTDAQNRVAQRMGREATGEEVRGELELGWSEYEKLLTRVKPHVFISLNDCTFDDSTGNSVLNEEITADERAPDGLAELLRGEDRELLHECLRKLPKTHGQVLVLYYIEDLQLKEIAKILQVTQSRVSQIHTLAIARLRENFQKTRSN